MAMFEKFSEKMKETIQARASGALAALAAAPQLPRLLRSVRLRASRTWTMTFPFRDPMSYRGVHLVM